MKKMFGLMILTLGLSISSAHAQTGGGGGQQMDPAQRLAMMKERFKTLGCNDVQTDSEMAMSNDFRPKMMAVRDLEPEARQEKMKEINADRNKRIEKALPADLAKKVIEALSMQRGGGRGPNE
jgi:hypothetical protein